MIFDTITLLDGSQVINLQAPRGTSFPANPDIGELFFRTDSDSLFVYKSTGWTAAGSGSGGGSITAGDISTALGYTPANAAALNATNLTTGTVGTARLGTGTANSTTYLRGDGTWAAAGGSSTALNGTTLPSGRNTNTTGLFVGATTYPFATFITSGAGLNVSQIYQDETNGAFNISFLPDTLANQTNFFTATRGAGEVAANITLAGTAITLSGAVTGTSFSGVGTNLTALNATNLTSGTVGVARLGTGTTNATTFLRGDGTWAAPVASATSLVASNNVTRSSATAVYVGTIPTLGDPIVTLANATAGADNRIVQLTQDDSGSFQVQLLNDTTASFSNVLTIARLGNTATNITLNGTAITLNGAVTGTSFSGVGTNLTALNASNLASGTVGTARLGTGTADATTYLRGDGTWAAAGAGSATFLNATGTSSPTPSATGVYVGSGSIPAITYVNILSNVNPNSKIYETRVDSAGTFQINMYNDALNSNPTAFSIARNGLTATNITLNGTAITLNGAVTGTSFSGIGTNLTALNATNLTSGTVGTARLGTGTASASTFLRGDGTWASASAGSATSLSATSTTPSPTGSTGTTGVYASAVGGQPTFWLVNQSAAADTRMSVIDQTNGGLLRFNFSNDTWGAATAWLSAQRGSGNTATNITLAGTAINLTATNGTLPTNITNVPFFNGTWTFGTTTNAQIAGNAGYPGMQMTTYGQAADSRVAQVLLDRDNGSLFMRYVNDASTVSTEFFRASRVAGTQATSQIALTGTTIALNGAVTGTSFSGIGTNLTALNATNLTSGTVGTARLGTGTANNTSFLRGDGTWAAPGAPTVLSATTTNPATTTTGVYAGTNANPEATLHFSNGSAPTGSKVVYFSLDSSGVFQGRLLNDTLLNQAPWMSVSRLNNTATNITFTGTAITLTGAVTGTSFSGNGAGLTSLSAANLTTGSVATARLGAGTASASTFLRGDGTWNPVNALSGTGATPFVTTNTGVYAGTLVSMPMIHMVNSNNSPGLRAWDIRVNANGKLSIGPLSDDTNTLNESISFSRTGVTTTIASITATTSVFNGTSVTPGGDNVTTLGTGALRWSTVYAATAAISTSDANLKQDIAALSNAEKLVATAIKGLIKKFRFKDAVLAKGAAARTHVGVIAQEVAAAFTAQGLDAHTYALFCEDTWYELNGTVVDAGTPGATSVTRLGIRYEELLAFVIAAL